MINRGYRLDEDYYTPGYLTKSIDTMMAKGAHFLLNAGPDGRGRIPEPAAEILTDIGNWYRTVREAFGDTVPATELTTNSDLFLTRRGKTLYAHLPALAKSDAVILSALSVLPEEAVLLNTGDRLETSIVTLPVHWKSNARVLRIKGLSDEKLAGSETLVIRLRFAEALAIGTDGIEEFQG